jgi:transcriptional regulator with XRE-family HTH domain
MAKKKRGRPAGLRGPYKSEDVEDPDQLGTGGIRLRQHRLARAWTVEKLAFESGLSTGTISNIENGVTGWSVESLSALAAALQTTVGALFDRDPRRGKEGEFFTLYDRLEPNQRQRAVDFMKGMVDHD